MPCGLDATVSIRDCESSRRCFDKTQVSLPFAELVVFPVPRSVRILFGVEYSTVCEIVLEMISVLLTKIYKKIILYLGSTTSD